MWRAKCEKSEESVARVQLIFMSQHTNTRTHTHTQHAYICRAAAAAGKLIKFITQRPCRSCGFASLPVRVCVCVCATYV